MSTVTTNKMTNWRWVMCAMLFFATTVNYMDRQVLSLTYKDFISPEFNWDDEIYGTITAVFSIFYAVANLFAGKFVDWMGTKKGYFWAIVVWSLGAVMHAGCGWFTFKVIGATGVVVATVSMYAFLACRCILALGEAGNFPAAIKVTAEYFPKKDRAFATSLFNAGASVGALAAPATIPLLAKSLGWEMAFVIIGALGFVWAGLWLFLYDKPAKSKHVNEAELKYVNQDEENEAAVAVEEEESKMGYKEAFSYKQTWSFAFGKFMTDGVWWFFLFWAPAYFSDQYGYATDSGTGMMLIITLYAIVTFLSFYGGYLPKLFVEKKGMNPYQGRMRAMLIFAFLPIVAIAAQPAGDISPWLPAILIGLVGAGHQAWSANIFSTVGDMFPKSAIATITGIGSMAGGLGSMLINKSSGSLFTAWAGKFRLGYMTAEDKDLEISRGSIQKVIDTQVDKAVDNANTSKEALQEAFNNLPSNVTENINFDVVEKAVNGGGTELHSHVSLVTDNLTSNDFVALLSQKAQILCDTYGGSITEAPIQGVLGFDGKPAAYMVVFCFCAVAYLIGWTVMKMLVPKYKPVVRK